MGVKTISPNLTHGKASTYARGCRCSPCRAAHAERILREQYQRSGQDPETFEHGKSGYSNRAYAIYIGPPA